MSMNRTDFSQFVVHFTKDSDPCCRSDCPKEVLQKLKEKRKIV
jgi:hypothetical protein